MELGTSRYSDVYTCSKVQNCVITLKTRKNCQFCRFRLCEKAGMKRSWVLADSDCKTAKVRYLGSGAGQTCMVLPSNSPWACLVHA